MKRLVRKSLSIFQKLGKKILLGILALIVIGVPLIYLTILNSKEAAAWWDNSWKYRKAIIITNSSGSALTNYQVSFTIDTTDSSKFQSTCGDIRTVDSDGTTQLSYWIETNNPGCNNSATKIWVKVPSIPTTGTTIYVYYGNPAASSAQSGTNTFAFFDDFDDTSKGWTTSSRYAIDTSNGVMTESIVRGGGQRAYVAVSYLNNTNWAIRGRLKVTAYADPFGTMISSTNDSTNAANALGQSVETASLATIFPTTAFWGNTGIARTSLQQVTLGTYTLGTWYPVDIKKAGSTVTYSAAGTTLSTTTVDLGTTQQYLYVGDSAGTTSGGTTASMDWILVRQYTTTEPTTSLSSETTGPGRPLAYWKFDEGQGQITQDSSGSNYTGTLGANTTSSADDPTWTEEGRCVSGKCLYFDGSNDYVGIGSSAPNIKTVSFWVKPKTNGEPLVLLDEGTHSISASSGTITATGFSSPTIYVNGVVSSTLTANTWQYVEVTTGTAFSSASMKIGTNGTTYLNGYIDEFKLYDYARSAAEVKADYNNRGSPKGASAQMGGADQGYLSKGLIGYWKTDESSDNAADSSGNSLTLTNNSSMAYATGNFGNGVQCDGTADYLNTATTISDIKTVSFWVKPSGVTNNYFINLITSSSYITVASGTISATGFTNPNIYVNGLKSSTLTTAVWSLVTITSDTGVNANAFAVGLTNDGSNHFCTNTTLLDEVRVYNRAFSPKEVSDLYNFAPGPVGYWNFEEGTGTSANDTSGNANTGTWNGTGSHWTSGKFGKAGNFNGSNDYLDMGNPTNGSLDFGTNNFTVQFWVRTSKTSRWDPIIKTDASSTQYYAIYYASSSNMTFDTSAGSGQNTPVTWSNPDVADGKWHQITGVRSGTSLFLYRDGIQVAQTTGTLRNVSNTGSLCIGKHCADNNFFVNGNIDEVKIYNYARTQKQIVSDMNAGHLSVGSPVGTAVGYWKFDEGYGTGAAGAHNFGGGGSALDGTLSGATVPSWTDVGKFGKALSFNGTTAYIAMPSDATALKITSDITLSAWINLTNTSSTHDIICKYTGTASTSAYCLYTDTSGKLNMSVVNSTGPAIVTTTGTRTLSASTWYHVVGVLNTTLGSVDLYVNGGLDKHNTTSIPTALQNPTTILDIGAENAGSNLFNGTIDEPKVYNFALTANEVKTEYNRGQSLQLGAAGTNSTYQTGAANQEYCIPGDTTSCAAPALEWKLEEKSGTNAYDTSGNGNTGILNGNSTWITGKTGSAIYFDGTNSYIRKSSYTEPTSDFSVAYWFKSDNAISNGWLTGGDHKILSGFGGNPGAGQIDPMGQLLSTGVIRAYLYNSSSFPDVSTTKSSWNANQWYHLAFTYKTSTKTITVYINGAFDNSNTATVTPTYGLTNFYIGGNTPYSTNYFKGSIDQTRIYNYTLSAAQIAWDYNRGKPVGWWKFDECQGTTAHDSSENSNNGTITIGASGEDTVGTCTTSSTAWGSGATGKRNYSLSFDGTDDKVTTAAFSPLATAAQTTTKFSWGGWFYPTTSAASKTLLEKATEFQLTTDSNSMPLCGIYYSGAFNNSTAPTTALSLNAWNHVICTYDGTNINTYLNGKLIKQSANTNSVTAASSIFYMGQTSGGANFYSGQIDDVKIFNYALTAAQVRDTYNGGAVTFGPVSGAP